jgi:hypothetical protein
MKAGRELDALVTEKVMGWNNNRDNPREPGMWGINDYRADGSPVLMPDFPCYSTDIAAAFDVVQIIKEPISLERELTWDFTIEFWSGLWHVGWKRWEDDWYIESEAETLPHAICLAALKAREVKI